MHGRKKTAAFSNTHPKGASAPFLFGAHEMHEYPKFVKAADHHVVRQVFPDGTVHISTPDFAEHHVNRVGGDVMVLVKDAEEEAMALGEKVVAAVTGSDQSSEP